MTKVLDLRPFVEFSCLVTAKNIEGWEGLSFMSIFFLVDENKTDKILTMLKQTYTTTVMAEPTIGKGYKVLW